MGSVGFSLRRRFAFGGLDHFGADVASGELRPQVEINRRGRRGANRRRGVLVWEGRVTRNAVAKGGHRGTPGADGRFDVFRKVGEAWDAVAEGGHGDAPRKTSLERMLGAVSVRCHYFNVSGGWEMISTD